MRKSLTVISLILLGLIPFAYAETIVVLGSSTAAGTGPSDPENAWVNRFQVFCTGISPDIEVVNYADGGVSTYHIMPTGYVPPPGRPSPDINRNITKALSLNPCAVIVNLPSNDNALGYSISEQLTNYDIVTAAGLSQNVPVWICSPQPVNYGTTINALQMELRDSVFNRYNCVIDFWNGLALPNGDIIEEYNVDGTHLNDDGHEVLFNRVRDVGITCGDYSLPVELSMFTATNSRNKIVLNWITESEIENNGFVLEKGTSETSLLFLAKIDGNGNSSISHDYTYEDFDVKNRIKYYYQLSSIDYSGQRHVYNTINIIYYSHKKNELINLYIYPNPSNSSVKLLLTNISDNLLTLNTGIKIYNILGECVKTIFEGYLQSNDEYLFIWDGKDDKGMKLPSGAYFIYISNSSFTISKKIIILK